MEFMKIISLRVWFPNVYGMYLIFVDGVPKACISIENLELLRDYSNKKCDIDTDSQIFSVLGLNSDKSVELIEIDPSESTILDDYKANEFIPVFYNYFGQIFYEGSPFIDSDGDFLPLISGYFPKETNSIGVDVGAGSGYYAKALANQISKVYACDIVTNRLKTLDQENIEIVECDVQRMDLPEECDFAMCNFVLEHVANPYKVCESIIRNLRNGGRIFLSFPSFSCRDIYAAKRLGEIATLNFEHLRSFTGEPGVHPWEEETMKIIDFLIQNGCCIKEIRGVNVTVGLDTKARNEIQPFIDIASYDSTNISPWNLYGQQTFIYAEKV